MESQNKKDQNIQDRKKIKKIYYNNFKYVENYVPLRFGNFILQ